jgi:hypothetical protein
VLDTLIAHDWVGRLDEGGPAPHPDVRAGHTPAAPLVDAAAGAPGGRPAFRQRTGLEQMTLAELLKG